MTGRPLLVVFLAALAVRLAYLALILALGGQDFLSTADSSLYLALGRALAEGTEPPGFATERMPLYGGFVALHHLVAGGATPIAVALSQCAIDAGTCVVVALIGRQLAPALTLWAGLAAAAVPTMVVIGPYVLTDTLFTAFAAVTLWAALRWHDRPDWRIAALLGVALAAAAMTRQVIVPWAVFVLVFLAAATLWRRRSAAVRLAHLSLAGVLVAAPLLGLAAHNHAKYGAFALSSQSGTHLLGWIVPLVMEAKDGTPHAEGAAEMSRLLRARHPDFGELGAFEQSRAQSALAVERLAELGPVPIAKAWTIGAAINLMAPASTQAAPVAALPRTGFYDTPGETKLDKIRAFLFENENAAYAWLLLLGVAGVGVVRALQLWGLAAGWSVLPEARWGLALLALWVLYVLAVSGPIAAPKYRLPAEPALAVFAALGLRDLWGRVAPSRLDRGRA